MSQVIPCLGLRFYTILFVFHTLLISTHVLSHLSLFTEKEIETWGYSKLPWRNPLETNNINFHLVTIASTKDFLYNLHSPPLYTLSFFLSKGKVCVLRII
jgi:hypothetical protein